MTTCEMAEDYAQRFDGLPHRTLAGGRKLVEASTYRARRVGLSKLDALPPDHALHIPRCPSVHTFGMRFALDLIWLDKRGAVIRIDHDVAARRMKACLRARSVVETAAGEGDAVAAALGDAGRPGE